MNTTAKKIVRKLSAKAILGDVKDIVANMRVNKTPEIACYRVIGNCHGTKTGHGEHGGWLAFLGVFESINYQTGEVINGSQCFLPSAISDSLASVLYATQDATGDKASVEFAVEVGLKLSDSAIGYEYTVTPLLDTRGADPLANLRAMLPAPADQVLLDAPDKKTAKAK